MRELFNILDKKEKKALTLLSLLIVIVFLFLIVFSLGEKRSYFRNLESMAGAKENLTKATIEAQKKRQEWLSWKEAQNDLQEIGEKYFYKDSDVFSQIRMDLQKIFKKSGLTISQLRYDYAQLKTGKIKRVAVSFNLKGSYYALKKFLNSVEIFPKFMLVERIDFLNISSGGSMLELKVSVVGYYES
ncbi:MAG: GspMb/PilO family protein [Candidatus Aminicenantales bacterium]